MARVILSTPADVDMQGAWSHIADHSFAAADHMIERCMDVFRQLESFPLIGEAHPHPTKSLRQITVPPLRHRLSSCRRGRDHRAHSPCCSAVGRPAVAAVVWERVQPAAETLSAVQVGLCPSLHRQRRRHRVRMHFNVARSKHLLPIKHQPMRRVIQSPAFQIQMLGPFQNAA